MQTHTQKHIENGCARHSTHTHTHRFQNISMMLWSNIPKLRTQFTWTMSILVLCVFLVLFFFGISICELVFGCVSAVTLAINIEICNHNMKCKRQRTKDEQVKSNVKFINRSFQPCSGRKKSFLFIEKVFDIMWHTHTSKQSMNINCLEIFGTFNILNKKIISH